MRVRASATAIMRLTGGPIGGTVSYSIGYRGSTVVASTTLGVIEWPTNSGSFEAAFLAPSVEVPHTFTWLAAGLYTTDDLEVGATEDVTLATLRTLPVGGPVSLANAVSQGNGVQIVQGNDYAEAESRALAWSTTDDGTWPALNGATAYMTVAYGPSAATYVATVIQATGASKRVDVPLSATQTGALAADVPWGYDLTAVLSNGHAVTLARSRFQVLLRTAP